MHYKNSKMKKNIVIVGSGAVAAEITSFLYDTNFASDCNLELKGYLEYDYNIEKYYKHYELSKPVLGDIDTYQIKDNDYFIVGIADISFRKKMIEKLENRNAKFINLIHPTAIISATAKIGMGNLINPYCIIGPEVVIGNYNILTSQSAISHDCVVGSNNFLATTILCGHVSIGDNNSFGIRASVIPNIVIGNNVVVQAGMTVDKNIPDGTTVFYRFKEKLFAIPK